MAKKKEIRTITGDWTKSLVNMELNKEVTVPIAEYDNVMSSARYRAKRKYGVLIERVGPLDYEKGIFRIKRIL